MLSGFSNKSSCEADYGWLDPTAFMLVLDSVKGDNYFANANRFLCSIVKFNDESEDKKWKAQAEFKEAFEKDLNQLIKDDRHDEMVSKSVCIAHYSGQDIGFMTCYCGKWLSLTDENLIGHFYDCKLKYEKMMKQNLKYKLVLAILNLHFEHLQLYLNEKQKEGDLSRLSLSMIINRNKDKYVKHMKALTLKYFDNNFVKEMNDAFSKPENAPFMYLIASKANQMPYNKFYGKGKSFIEHNHDSFATIDKLLENECKDIEENEENEENEANARLREPPKKRRKVSDNSERNLRNRIIVIGNYNNLQLDNSQRNNNKVLKNGSMIGRTIGSRVGNTCAVSSTVGNRRTVGNGATVGNRGTVGSSVSGAIGSTVSGAIGGTVGSTIGSGNLPSSWNGMASMMYSPFANNNGINGLHFGRYGMNGNYNQMLNGTNVPNMQYMPNVQYMQYMQYMQNMQNMQNMPFAANPNRQFIQSMNPMQQLPNNVNNENNINNMNNMNNMGNMNDGNDGYNNDGNNVNNENMGNLDENIN